MRIHRPASFCIILSVLVLASCAPKPVAIQVHAATVDLTNTGFVMFSIDAESKDGAIGGATLEYWVDEGPRQRHDIDPAVIQGSFLIADYTVEQSDLAFDKTVFFHWLVEDGDGKEFDTGIRRFFNADISEWKRLPWKRLTTEHFVHDYKWNESMIESYAALAERAYVYLSKAYERTLPDRIKIVYYDGQLHAYIEDNPKYGTAVGYMDLWQNEIRLLENWNSDRWMYYLMVHELTHVFDGATMAKSELMHELHATYMALEILPASERLITDQDIVAMNDDAIDSLRNGNNWGYSEPLAWGFFENIAVKYAEGTRDTLSAIIMRQEGSSLVEKLEHLTGHSLDELFDETYAFLKDYRDHIRRTDQQPPAIVEVLARTVVESKRWLPRYGRFSRDGTRMLARGDYYPDWNEAFVQPVPEPTRDIDEVMILDVATGELVDLTKDSYSQWSPVWSPDETDIFFTGRYGPGYGIYRMDPEGIIRGKLLDSEERLGFILLSDDGTSIVFSIEEGMERTNIFMLDIAGGAVSRLTDGDFYVTSCFTLEKGKYLFASRNESEGALFFLDGASGQVERLPVDAYVHKACCVSPDGSLALVMADGRYALCDLRTGALRPMRFEDQLHWIIASTFTAEGDIQALTVIRSWDFSYEYAIEKIRAW